MRYVGGISAGLSRAVPWREFLKEVFGWVGFGLGGHTYLSVLRVHSWVSHVLGTNWGQLHGRQVPKILDFCSVSFGGHTRLHLGLFQGLPAQGSRQCPTSNSGFHTGKAKTPSLSCTPGSSFLLNSIINKRFSGLFLGQGSLLALC